MCRFLLVRLKNLHLSYGIYETSQHAGPTLWFAFSWCQFRLHFEQFVILYLLFIWPNYILFLLPHVIYQCFLYFIRLSSWDPLFWLSQNTSLFLLDFCLFPLSFSLSLLHGPELVWNRYYIFSTFTSHLIGIFMPHIKVLTLLITK